MIFALFALAIAAAFFASSLILLNYGRHLGLRYLQRQKETANMAGLTTVEGAVFALIGLLLAFTISGALQRFDERRQLVVQEANARPARLMTVLVCSKVMLVATWRPKLKEYVEARIDLYRMPHDFSLWRRSEHFSPEQQEKTVDLKNKVLGRGGGQPAHRPAFGRRVRQALPALTSLFEVARLRLGASEKHPPQIVYVMLFGLGLGGSLLAGFGMAAATARSWIHMLIFGRHLNGYTLCCYGHGVSAARPDSH